MLLTLFATPSDTAAVVSGKVLAAKRHYKRDLKEVVAVRRYTGVGASREVTGDYASVARVVHYRADQLAGSVTQGVSEAIVYADDLIDNGLDLPLTTADKLVVDGGKELAILGVDDRTRRIEGELIAFVLQVKGS